MEGKGADETRSLYYWIILKVNRLTLFYEINRRESKGKYKSEYIKNIYLVASSLSYGTQIFVVSCGIFCCGSWTL